MVSMATISLLLYTGRADAQPQSVAASYDIGRLRLLLQMTSLHLFTSNQGLIDLDSAVIVACGLQNRRMSLAYDEGFNPSGGRLPGDSLPERRTIARTIQQMNSTSGRNRIILQLQLGIHFLFKAGDDSLDMAQARNYLSLAKAEGQVAFPQLSEEAAILLSRCYIKNGQPALGKKELMHVLDKRLKAGRANAIADIENIIGTNLPYSDPEKIVYLRRALRGYERASNVVKQIEVWSRITDVHFRESKIDSVKFELLRSLEMQESIGFKHNHYTHSVLSYVEFLLENSYKGLYHATQSVKSMEATGDTALATWFYHRLGTAYQSVQHYDEALLWLDRAISKNYRKTNRMFWYKSFLTAVQVLADLNRHQEGLTLINEVISEYPPDNGFDKMSVAFVTGRCYEGMHQLDQSEKYYREMAYWAGTLTDLQMQKDKAHAYAVLTLHLILLNKIPEAKIYLEKSKSLISPASLAYTREKLYEAEFKIDSASGNYLSAIRFHQKYVTLKDSLFNVNRTKQIEELKIQYETERQKNEMDLLTQRSALQQSELENERLSKNLVLGSAIALVVLLILLYNRFRIKQQKEKEISRKNADLQRLVEEKEWLMKEIHHRVKNNLQVVVSLLSSQSSYLDSEPAQMAIRNSQHRMHAMSLIHQQLYQSDSVATIDMLGYIKNLVKYLQESLHTGNRIRFEVNVNDIELDASQAVPVGLILNEAITNAMKYAFTSHDNGVICITMKRQQSKFDIMLQIRDNGSGFMEGFDAKATASFGLSLINGLTKQLDGTCTFLNDNGVVLTIEFADELLRNQSVQ
jgi:two-component sensor histidine kinase